MHDLASTAKNQTFTERRLRELAERLSIMHGAPVPQDDAGADARLRALERDAELDRERLRAAQAELASLQAEVRRALASASVASDGPSATDAAPYDVDSCDAVRSGADELAAVLRLELAQERRLRDESDERLGRDVAVDLARLAEEVVSEREALEAQEARLRQRTADGLRAAYDALDAERAAREGAHVSFLSLLEDIARRTREELAQERRQRQLTDELVREMASRLGIS